MNANVARLHSMNKSSKNAKNVTLGDPTFLLVQEEFGRWILFQITYRSIYFTILWTVMWVVVQGLHSVTSYKICI